MKVFIATHIWFLLLQHLVGKIWMAVGFNPVDLGSTLLVMLPACVFVRQTNLPNNSVTQNYMWCVDAGSPNRSGVLVFVQCHRHQPVLKEW